jgi:hypothetical protein
VIALRVFCGFTIGSWDLNFLNLLGRYLRRKCVIWMRNFGTLEASAELKQSFITTFVIRLEDAVVGIWACQEIWLDSRPTRFDSADMMSMIVSRTEAMPITGEGFRAVVYAAARAANCDSVNYNYMQFFWTKLAMGMSC